MRVKPHKERPAQARRKQRREEFWIELCGWPIPARNTEWGRTAIKISTPLRAIFLHLWPHACHPSRLGQQFQFFGVESRLQRSVGAVHADLEHRNDRSRVAWVADVTPITWRYPDAIADIQLGPRL